MTLEYGISRGLGAKAFIAFNPDKTERKDVPTGVRGYGRLQYTDFDELSDKVATLVTQELGRGPTSVDPMEADRGRLMNAIQLSPGLKAKELADVIGERLGYVQLLLRRSSAELETTGATRETPLLPEGWRTFRFVTCRVGCGAGSRCAQWPRG